MCFVWESVFCEAYVPEDEKEAVLMEEDLDAEDSAQEGDEPSAKFLCQEKDFLLKDRPGSTGFHGSPNAADFSGQELDSESHLSESSDRMSDFESLSLKNEDDGLLSKDSSNALSTAMSVAAANSSTPVSSDEAMLVATGSVADSLEKMKAIYTSFLTNSYWSTLNLNLAQPPEPQPQPKRSHSSSSSSSSSSSCGSGGYDWHQTAIAKTLQQASQNHHNRLAMIPQTTVAVSNASNEPNLFSTVQLYRQSSKLYGSIFTGASKFRCKDCSGAYDTLVELTVHMNETGHYRDDNHETDSEGTRRWSKPRKRSLLEMEGKEDAQKVLKCMYCGHSFESLQDLSVHMIKTKHYQKVPLKEPVTPVAAKIISNARKKVPIELDIPSSPDSNGANTPKPSSLNEPNDILQKNSNPYITANNRYGHQNGASYAWHEAGESARGESPKENRTGGCKTPESMAVVEKGDTNHKETNGEVKENGVDSPSVTSPLPSMLCSSTAIITDHPPPEQPFVNPLSALQSVMNVHLGKAAKPALPSLDPMSMLFKMSNSLAEKAAVAASTPPAQSKKPCNDHLERYFYQQHVSNDQPIDLTKGKHGEKNGGPMGPTTLSSSTSTPSSVSPSAAVTMSKASAALASFMSSSPLRENALSDISDMLRNLTESQVVSKSSTPTSLSERSDIEGATHEETEDISPAQKRKGRQSNWNPQHLLILQAQFASSLRQTNDGKYMMSDLSPQERMHISRFTGLSMTTISHWLANVKYQLRRTGGTKFLKNLDSGHPVFFCSDCASQIRSPSTYVSHLESHLGFRLRDLAKLSGEQLLSQISQHNHHRHTKGLSEKLLSSLHPSSHPLPSSLPTALPPSIPISLPSSVPTSLPPTKSPSPAAEEEDCGAMHQCKLCNRTFASKHAVKLHLSKTHGKSPEDHLMYVCELEKQ
uniref:Teashirt zinc finger homeobox 3b n=1 Tax=Knipowitschia caucasica TaxID=637954 RepID=A0AAV2LRV9_KNICA